MVNITFVTHPAGCDIYLGDPQLDPESQTPIYRGTTTQKVYACQITGTFDIDLPLGKDIIYRISKPGCRENTGRFMLQEGGMTTLTFSLYGCPTSIQGSLCIVTSPVGGALVYIDGVTTGQVTQSSIGFTRCNNICAEPGYHTYTVYLEGYQTQTGSIYAVAGQTVSLYLQLSLAPITGTLYITNPPSGARIYVDNVDKGIASNGMSITNISPGSHSYKITLAGYPDKIGTFNITSGLTTALDLSSYPTTGSIAITSSPAGAWIYIDNISQGALTPKTISGITPGSHTVKLTLSGYQDYSQITNVTGGQTTTINAGNLVLIPPTVGSLNIVSSPTGAWIYIDDISQGSKTPNTVDNLAPGNHNVKLVMSGYQDWINTINVIAGQTINVSAELTKELPTTGNVRIDSDPSRASIYVDGTNKGIITPTTISDLIQGDHTIELTLSGYKNWVNTFNIVAGKTSQISATLTPIIYTGNVYIESSPPGAEIYIDGVDKLEITPNIITELYHGSHTYELRLTGYVSKSGIFDIVTGQTTNIFDLLISAYPTTGKVYIESNPPGAEIYIDDVDKKMTTPAIISNILPGSHVYKLSIKDYYDATNTFDILAGQTTNISSTLSLMTGYTFVTSEPTGAMIYIDDKLQEGVITPATITGLSPGSHNYKLALFGYQDLIGTLNMIPGELTSNFGNMKLSPVIIAGGAGLLIGATIVGIILLKKRK